MAVACGGRDAEAEGRRHAAADAVDRVGGEVPADLVEDDQRALGAEAREGDGELVAAEAPHHRSRRQRPGEGPGPGRQHGVARLPAQLLVQRPEPVQVGEADGDAIGADRVVDGGDEVVDLDHLAVAVPVHGDTHDIYM